MTVTWTVSNLGNIAAAEDWWDSVYLSTDTRLDFEDKKLLDVSAADQSPLPPLGAAGNRYTFVKQVTLPADTQPGDYHLVFATDVYTNGPSAYNERQPEADNANNIASSPLKVVGPDLTVENVRIDRTQSPTNGTVHVSWTVKNAATNGVAATAKWFDTVYVSVDGKLLNDDRPIKIVDQSARTNLAAGGSYTTEADVTLPSLGSGPVHLIVVTDDHGTDFSESNKQGESNEANNEAASAPLQVRAADLIVKNVTATNVVLGDFVKVTWTVENISDNPAIAQWSDGVWLSDDETIGGGDKLLGTVAKPFTAALNGHKEYDNELSVKIPGNAGTGPKFLIVRADEPDFHHDKGYQGEDNETNNEK